MKVLLMVFALVGGNAFADCGGSSPQQVVERYIHAARRGDNEAAASVLHRTARPSLAWDGMFAEIGAATRGADFGVSSRAFVVEESAPRVLEVVGWRRTWEDPTTMIFLKAYVTCSHYCVNTATHTATSNGCSIVDVTVDY